MPILHNRFDDLKTQRLKALNKLDHVLSRKNEKLSIKTLCQNTVQSYLLSAQFIISTELHAQIMLLIGVMT